MPNGGWKCRDCGLHIAETEQAEGWVSIMAIDIKTHADSKKGMMVKPWYVLCKHCRTEYDIPADLSEELPEDYGIE
jgi:hypothetical protein